MPQITDFKQDNEGVYITKDNVSKLNYTIDWGQWVEQLPGSDSIATSTVTASNTVGDSSSLAVSGVTVQTNRVLFDLDGGETGQVYAVKVIIVTANGYKDARTFRVKVIERQL